MIGIGAAGPRLPVEDATEADPGARPGAAAAVERDAWTVIAAVDSVGPVAFAALLDRFGSGRGILAAAGGPDAIDVLAATPVLRGRDVAERRPVPPSVAAAIVRAVENGPVVLARLRELGIGTVTLDEPGYPPALAATAMPPHVLFVQGEAAALARPRAVAIVGTRRPTTSGRTTAGRLARALVAVDAVVVSGLAYGIDGSAHEATLGADGTTVAVIGGGHATGIPGGHRRLADAILRAGGAIVSEHAPDVLPTRGTFPRRNRIISGLSAATVVVEAPARSGALLTASWALEQGRECFLVPGAIDAPMSAGCLAFLREWPDAARIVAGVPQLIADLGYADVGAAGADRAPTGVAGAAVADLGATGRHVAAELTRGRVTVDELVAATDLPVPAVLATLAVLEGRGLAIGIHGRYRPAGALLGDWRSPPIR